MKNILAVLILAAVLVGCESLYDTEDIPRIRSQRQVDAYNETVSSAGEKLVCSKERPLGSNISQFVCMTQNQQDRIAAQSQQAIRDVGLNGN
jgi:hypothetical protein